MSTVYNNMLRSREPNVSIGYKYDEHKNTIQFDKLDERINVKSKLSCFDKFLDTLRSIFGQRKWEPIFIKTTEKNPLIVYINIAKFKGIVSDRFSHYSTHIANESEMPQLELQKKELVNIFEQFHNKCNLSPSDYSKSNIERIDFILERNGDMLKTASKLKARMDSPRRQRHSEESDDEIQVSDDEIMADAKASKQRDLAALEPKRSESRVPSPETQSEEPSSPSSSDSRTPSPTSMVADSDSETMSPVMVEEDDEEEIQEAPPIPEAPKHIEPAITWNNDLLKAYEELSDADLRSGSIIMPNAPTDKYAKAFAPNGKKANKEFLALLEGTYGTKLDKDQSLD